MLIMYSGKWLRWTVTMRLKPPKCRALALHQEHKQDRYVQYDPELQIDGQVLKPLGNEAFKMLGRKLFASLSEVSLQEDLKASVQARMGKIDATALNGAQKAWLYNHCVLPRLTWPFMVYD